MQVRQLDLFGNKLSTKELLAEIESIYIYVVFDDGKKPVFHLAENDQLTLCSTRIHDERRHGSKSAKVMFEKPQDKRICKICEHLK